MQEYKQDENEKPVSFTAPELGVIYNFFRGMVQDLTTQLDNTGADNLQFRVQLKAGIEQAKNLCFKAEALGKAAVNEHNAEVMAAIARRKKMIAEVEAKAELMKIPAPELDKSLVGE